ncbi:hypothetical protein [Pseudomonas sp. PDM27]|uniref:hypothetical protein n=1 Tax=Pseudomonas sp. PDM27 TaxID=2854769 RepID=UPI001C494B88|nr:hypothetical protein [Pseudomonas sp. PDM27]MBV7565826.1 hypothetical protein [Pseudomonas sp. PDM27]
MEVGKILTPWRIFRLVKTTRQPKCHRPASIDVLDQGDAADKNSDRTVLSKVGIRNFPGDYVLQRYASMCHQAEVPHQ